MIGEYLRKVKYEGADVARIADPITLKKIQWSIEEDGRNDTREYLTDASRGTHNINEESSQAAQVNYVNSYRLPETHEGYNRIVRFYRKDVPKVLKEMGVNFKHVVDEETGNGWWEIDLSEGYSGHVYAFNIDDDSSAEFPLRNARIYLPSVDWLISKQDKEGMIKTGLIDEYLGRNKEITTKTERKFLEDFKEFMKSSGKKFHFQNLKNFMEQETYGMNERMYRVEEDHRYIKTYLTNRQYSFMSDKFYNAFQQVSATYTEEAGLGDYGGAHGNPPPYVRV